jgi:hypothetical protein
MFLSFCVALLRREFTGRIAPRIGWPHCAANEMALYGRELTTLPLLSSYIRKGVYRISGKAVLRIRTAACRTRCKAVEVP